MNRSLLSFAAGFFVFDGAVNLESIADGEQLGNSMGLAHSQLNAILREMGILF